MTTTGVPVPAGLRARVRRITDGGPGGDPGRRPERRRPLHPAAWWVWAAGMAVAASKTTNPILLALLGCVVAFVVAARRTDAPWSRSLAFFLRLGVFVIVIRVVIQMIFGDRVPGHVLFDLPSIGLPSWAAGVSIGGPVTAESMLGALSEGMRLAVILLCFGAANSLASPYRLLRCLPAVLYEAGVAVTVALAFAPELVISIAAVREARRLRGRPTRGLAGLRGLAIPVLESALDRSLHLALSMDARGFGRRSQLPGRARRGATAAVTVGFLLTALGVYGSLDPGSSALLGLPAVVLGMACLVVGVAVRGRRSVRTRYRPDLWRGREWVVALSGVAAAAAFGVAASMDPGGVQTSFSPLVAPSLPLVACGGALLGLLPAVAAPAPPVHRTRLASAPTGGARA